MHTFRVCFFLYLFGLFFCRFWRTALVGCVRKGHRKCRELWPESTRYYERSYNLLLDAALLIVPLVMLSSAYFSITKTLWQGMALERSNGRRYNHKSTANNGYQRTGELIFAFILYIFFNFVCAFSFSSGDVEGFTFSREWLNAMRAFSDVLRGVRVQCNARTVCFHWKRNKWVE